MYFRNCEKEANLLRARFQYASEKGEKNPQNCTKPSQKLKNFIQLLKKNKYKASFPKLKKETAGALNILLSHRETLSFFD